MVAELFRKEIEGTELGKKFRVASCGIAAIDGEPASINAQRAVKELGGDLSEHRSRRISQAILDETRVLVGLTQTHLDDVATFFTRIPPITFVIATPDPFGANIEGYRKARDVAVESFPQLIEFLKTLPETDD